MDKKIMDELRAVRSFQAPDLQSENEAGKITGHAAVFGQMTNIGGFFNEVIERGAFDECDLSDVLFYVNHNDQKIPLARSRRNNGNSTMQISIDDEGLKVEALLDIDNNQEARSLCSAISRGDIDGMSFAFRIKEQKWENLDSDMPTRRILRFARVYEVSAVNMPAYDGTSIYARSQEVLENASAALDSARMTELDNSGQNEVEILKLRNQILAKN